MNSIYFKEIIVETPVGNKYQGLLATGEISAVIILRAGATFEVCPIVYHPLNVNLIAENS
jgi:uracil phosphoribosyltransferase